MSNQDVPKPQDSGAHIEGPKLSATSLSKINLASLRPTISSTQNDEKKATNDKTEPEFDHHKSEAQTSRGLKLYKPESDETKLSSDSKHSNLPFQEKVLLETKPSISKGKDKLQDAQPGERVPFSPATRNETPKLFATSLLSQIDLSKLRSSPSLSHSKSYTPRVIKTDPVQNKNIPGPLTNQGLHLNATPSEDGNKSQETLPTGTSEGSETLDPISVRTILPPANTKSVDAEAKSELPVPVAELNTKNPLDDNIKARDGKKYANHTSELSQNSVISDVPISSYTPKLFATSLLSKVDMSILRPSSSSSRNYRKVAEANPSSQSKNKIENRPKVETHIIGKEPLNDTFSPSKIDSVLSKELPLMNREIIQTDEENQSKTEPSFQVSADPLPVKEEKSQGNPNDQDNKKYANLAVETSPKSALILNQEPVFPAYVPKLFATSILSKIDPAILGRKSTKKIAKAPEKDRLEPVKGTSRFGLLQANESPLVLRTEKLHSEKKPLVGSRQYQSESPSTSVGGPNALDGDESVKNVTQPVPISISNPQLLPVTDNLTDQTQKKDSVPPSVDPLPPQISESNDDVKRVTKSTHEIIPSENDTEPLTPESQSLYPDSVLSQLAAYQEITSGVDTNVPQSTSDILVSNSKSPTSNGKVEEDEDQIPSNETLPKSRSSISLEGVKDEKSFSSSLLSPPKATILEVPLSSSNRATTTIDSVSEPDNTPSQIKTEDTKVHTPKLEPVSEKAFPETENQIHDQLSTSIDGNQSFNPSGESPDMLSTDNIYADEAKPPSLNVPQSNENSQAGDLTPTSIIIAPIVNSTDQTEKSNPEPQASASPIIPRNLSTEREIYQLFPASILPTVNPFVQQSSNVLEAKDDKKSSEPLDKTQTPKDNPNQQVEPTKEKDSKILKPDPKSSKPSNSDLKKSPQSIQAEKDNPEVDKQPPSAVIPPPSTGESQPKPKRKCCPCCKKKAPKPTGESQPKPKRKGCPCCKKKLPKPPQEKKPGKRCCNCCNCCKCTKETCCNPLCGIIWLIIFIGVVLELHLTCSSCEGAVSAAKYGATLLISPAISLAFVYIAFVIICCIIFLILMKLNARQKCWGGTKQAILAIHLIMGVLVVILVYYVLSFFKNDPDGKEKHCLKKCLTYVLVMLVLGVIPYVVFSLVYRKVRNQVRPAVIDVERYRNRTTFKDPCDCGSYNWKTRRVPGLPSPCAERLNNPVQKRYYPPPEAFPRSAAHSEQSCRSTGFSPYRNFTDQRTYGNYGVESRPAKPEQHVFVNVFSLQR